MKLFGLYGSRPMALARISGMGFFRDRRREAKSVSTAQYIRQNGAMTTLIAANLSGAMSAPPSAIGEITHTSASLSGGMDRASFTEAHTQYSFIAVVALMSLFLIVTVTATGLMLAFCRKKNAVFTAPEKSDADSNLELDDIDNSDVDICRGEKGECYYHLSDDYDDDGNDDSAGEDNDNKKDNERVRKISKRSRTFPQLKKVLVRRRGKVCGIGKETQMSTVNEPLMHKVEVVVNGIHTHDDHKSAQVGPVLANQSILDRQGAKPLCRNPNHRHYSRRHHNCLYNRPHFHNADHHHHQHHQRPSRLQQFNGACGSRLQRSHTIHYIPQTGRCDHRGPTACGVQITVQDAETVMLGQQETEELGTVQLHRVPTISSSIKYNHGEVYHTEDLFTDHDQDISFTNLQLRLDHGQHNFATADGGGQAFLDHDTSTNATPWTMVGDTYTADQNASMVKSKSNDSTLLGEFLTCAAGSYPSSDCIFNRDKPPNEATPQAFRHDQLGSASQYQHYPHPADDQHVQAIQFNAFHNLFNLETRSDADLSDIVPSANTGHVENEHPLRSRLTSSSTRILPPPQASSNNRGIPHDKNAEIKTGVLDFPVQAEINHIDYRTNQRTSEMHVDRNAAIAGCNSNYGLLVGHSQLDINISANPEEASQKIHAGDRLGARPGNANRSLLREDESRCGEDGDYGDDEEMDENKRNENCSRRVDAKTCNEIGSDEDQDDLTLSLLK